MPVTEISSSDNTFVKEYRRLSAASRYRRRAGRLAIEGPRLLEEALAAGHIPEVVFFTRSYIEGGGKEILSGLPPESRRYLLAPSLFAGLADTETPQEIAAIIPYRGPDSAEIAARPLNLVLVLDRIGDPGNMGAIIRTASAAGVDALFYGPGNVDPHSPKVLRSTAGALFHLPPAAVTDLLQLVRGLQKKGMTVIAARPQGGRLYWDADYRGKIVLLIGSESRGLSAELSEAADLAVSIPQSSPLESLNASVAAALIMYEALRQRTMTGGAPRGS